MRSDRRLPLLACTLLAGFFVVLGAVAGGLYWQRVESRSEQLTRAELPLRAVEAVRRIYNYDYQTVERTMMESYPLFTRPYRTQVEQRATEEIIPETRDMRIVNQINVVGVGMIDAHRDSGSVLVYLARTVSAGEAKEKHYDSAGLRLDYRKIGSEWLIDNMLPV